MKIAFLAPPFHGHARPLWQLACELSQRPGVECVFLDCFAEPLAYTGGEAVQMIRLETCFEQNLRKSSLGAADSLLQDLARDLANLYGEILPPLLERLADWQPDLLVSDHFFSFGPIVAGRMALPYLVIYSTPDIFLMDQGAESKSAAFDLMLERKKVSGFRELMRESCGMDVIQYPLSPYGNLCFAPALLKEWNPSAFDTQDIVQAGLTWNSFRSFVDGKHYPLLAINHSTPALQAQANDAVLQDYLAEPGFTSVLISFGTVWLRQLGGAKIESAFIALLRNLLLATDASKYRILFSGDVRHLEAAADGLALRSQLRHESFINQRHLVRYADVFVFHGGFNSFCEAMAAQTPMLIFPKGFDQGRVANLACQLGVGERVPFSMNTAKLVEAKMRKITDEEGSTYLANLATHAGAFSAPTQVDAVLDATIDAVHRHRDCSLHSAEQP